MSSDRERYSRVHEILSGARDLQGRELDEFLTAECGSDDSLRAEVLALLEAGRGESGDPFGEEGLRGARAALEGVLDEATTDWLPDTVGEYRILRQIGRGGMGVVYEAQQASPQRRVAIKLLHPLHQTEQRLRRFRQEAALLGRLQHPGIAQIFEASTFDMGRGPQPFFAMELVEGVDIRTYCDRADLDLSGRIELIASVADAVHHAHEHGIIHRDLKPANVLVDRQGRSRVLDFGIARTDVQSTGVSSLVTEEGQLIGTLAYMAPEQLTSTGAALTRRVDVFALGVLGFELLLGRLPREIDDLPLPQIIATLAENEPARAGTFDTRLRGDVETILGKALETDPDRRYESASALAGDLRRFLDDQPIRAHPPSRIYRVRKFVRRNRALVTGTLATLGVAIVGAIVAARLAVVATNRADQLERRTADVLRLSLAQEYEDLIVTADALWPAHPDQIPGLEAWLDQARSVASELPALVAKREELRAVALPQSDGERLAERESHPEYPRLVRVESQLVYHRNALLQRRDGKPVELPEVNWDEYPEDPAALHAMARGLVSPTRIHFGDEALGAVLAERAIEFAREGERSSIATTLAQAYYALGRDDEAVGLAYLALDEASESERAKKQADVYSLEEFSAKASTPEAFEAAEARIQTLETEMAELRTRVSERRDWTFPEETENETRARWWHGQLSGLIEEVESLMADGAGLLDEDGVSVRHGWSVPKRLAFARRLADGFAPGGEHARRWDSAMPALSAVYPDLGLVPQAGLVPISPDPSTGLWEFWHVQSGAEPVRGEDGRFVMEPESGLVFVLIPAGQFWMGAQKRDPQAPNFDPEAVSNEWPIHEVELSAFFLSKFEMTQSQWKRATSANPSRWTADTFSGWIEGEHPVEHLSWSDCMKALPRLGLSLPSEAQWEYACRAGTSTPQPFPREAFSLHANIADISFARAYNGGAHASWDDGLGGHAPVGSLAPNGFGLHDVIGNVWEWCLDGYDPDFYGRSPRKDPVNPYQDSDIRVPRGGSFFSRPVAARSAPRSVNTPSDADDRLGVRPSRRVVPAPESD